MDRFETIACSPFTVVFTHASTVKSPVPKSSEPLAGSAMLTLSSVPSKRAGGVGVADQRSRYAEDDAELVRARIRAGLVGGVVPELSPSRQ